MRKLLLVIGAVAACSGSGNRENSPICGFQSMAAATLVLEQLRGGTKTLGQVPTGIADVVPARVVGHGTSRALAAQGAEGLVLGYEGEGFPTRPGFGLLVMEDSLDTFQGVLIYDLDPPAELPRLGAISSAQTTIPLYGVRVTWGAVSSERCPLFAHIDTGGGSQ